jgi:hypothetical protein
MNNVHTLIDNVTVTKVVRTPYSEITVAWEKPVIVVDSETTEMNLSFHVNPNIALGDEGKLLMVDGFWMFQPTDMYYKKQLQKTLPAVIRKDGDIPTMVVTSSSGFTKNLSINLESIPLIREYLNIVEAKLQGAK